MYVYDYMHIHKYTHRVRGLPARRGGPRTWRRPTGASDHESELSEFTCDYYVIIAKPPFTKPPL